MQRLESLFIDIVRQAQRERRPTSGAVNRLEVTQEEMSAAMADVLDKLVAAKVETQKPAEAKRPVETIAVEPDRNILNKLTKENPEDLTTSVPKVEQSEPAVQKQDSIKKDILDELLGKSEGAGDSSNG
jgi:hypothetical protein